MEPRHRWLVFRLRFLMSHLIPYLYIYIHSWCKTETQSISNTYMLSSSIKFPQNKCIKVFKMFPLWINPISNYAWEILLKMNWQWYLCFLSNRKKAKKMYISWSSILRDKSMLTLMIFYFPIPSTVRLMRTKWLFPRKNLEEWFNNSK